VAQVLERVWFFRDVILAAVLGGLGCSLVGFYLSHLRLPFLGVCLSHAAMAGAVLGLLIGGPVGVLALAAAVLVGTAVGPLADRTGLDPNAAMATLFSLTMGLAFLGIGLLPGPKDQALGLIWGSVLFVSRTDLMWMAVALVAAVGFVLAMGKELRAVLFSREVAAASGVQADRVYYLLLLVASATVVVNLNTVGGLMLFSLLVNPCAAASRLVDTYGASLALTLVLGVVSAVGGLAVSLAANVPAGASIVVVSSGLFVLSVGLRRWRGQQD